MTIPMTGADPAARTMSSPAVTAYAAALKTIAAAEPDVADAIAGELASQRRQLKLIASENYASPAVLLAMGNLCRSETRSCR
jgi:glycine hydroxymethyltransferase